jgi:PAS domain S-box-containing protein
MKQNFVLSGLDDMSDILQLSSDGTPCVMVSGEPEKLGTISQCNSGASRIFGYQAYEMKNQKVEKLMPELYGK